MLLYANESINYHTVRLTHLPPPPALSSTLIVRPSSFERCRPSAF